MKKILLIAVLAVGGLLGYNYFTSGELTLIPSSPTEVERELNDLERDLTAARRQVTQGSRGAALGGIDTTADIEAARRTLEQIDRALKQLESSIETDAERRRANRLAESIQQFRRELRG